MSEVEPGTRDRSEMHDAVEPTANVDRLTYVRLDEMKPILVLEMTDVAFRPSDEIVDADHFVPGRK